MWQGNTVHFLLNYIYMRNRQTQGIQNDSSHISKLCSDGKIFARNKATEKKCRNVDEKFKHLLSVWQCCCRQWNASFFWKIVYLSSWFYRFFSWVCCWMLVLFGFYSSSSSFVSGVQFWHARIRVGGKCCGSRIYLPDSSICWLLTNWKKKYISVQLNKRKAHKHFSD